MLLELEVKVRIGKTARAPMFECHDVAGLGRKLWVPVATPLAFGKVMPLHNLALARARMTPALVIARLPPAVRYIHDLNTGTSDGPVDDSKIVEQTNFSSHVLDEGPNLASIRKEVVIGIDEQQCRRFGFVGDRAH